MNFRSRKRHNLVKRSRKGFRGYPVGTIAFYGPDDRRATKVAVGIISRAGAEPDFMERWHVEEGDARFDDGIADRIYDFLARHNVVTVATVDRLLGCPHEEGIDYPMGSFCPECPYWRGRERFPD